MKTPLIILASALILLIYTPISFAEKSIAVSLDNDLFAPRQTDRDYTAGIAVKIFDDSNVAQLPALDRALAAADKLAGGSAILTAKQNHTAVEFGFYGITPEEIDNAHIIPNDRPYSSLIYLSASRAYQAANSLNGWTSSLTVGALGLDVFKASQNTVHRLVGSKRAEGWRHQISDGGELTARYSLAYHDYTSLNSQRTKLKLSYFSSLGYLTETGVALSFRDGLISSPSNRFNPELAHYGEHATDTGGGQSREHYFWAGVSLKARAYNAFLQGQFRQSRHTISHEDVRYLLAEAWLGYTFALSRHYTLSYVARVQSSEIQGGKGDRLLSWGGLVLSRTL